MAPITVDPAKVREFEDAEAFYEWLGKHHDAEDEVWIKIHKVGSGLLSITPKEAIDVALCWGWIDAVPEANAMLAKLSAQNRFALAFRVHNMKTEAGRRKKIETFVAMLARGETIHPQNTK